jgi:hypothetical protein
MSDTNVPDKPTPEERGFTEIKAEDKIAQRDEINQDDNEWWSNKSNPEWPKAIQRAARPKSKLKREHLISSRQQRGIRHVK